MSSYYKECKMEPNDSNQTNSTKKVSIASLMPKPIIEYIKEEPDDTETSINDEHESENQTLESEDMYHPPEYEHLYHPPGSEDINQPPDSVQQPKIKNFPMPVRIKIERESPSPTMEMIPFKKIKLEKQSNSQAETVAIPLQETLQDKTADTETPAKSKRGGIQRKIRAELKNLYILASQAQGYEKQKFVNEINKLRQKRKTLNKNKKNKNKIHKYTQQYY